MIWKWVFNYHYLYILFTSWDKYNNKSWLFLCAATLLFQGRIKSINSTDYLIDKMTLCYNYIIIVIGVIKHWINLCWHYILSGSSMLLILSKGQQNKHSVFDDGVFFLPSIFNWLAMSRLCGVTFSVMLYLFSFFLMLLFEQWLCFYKRNLIIIVRYHIS